MIGTDRFGNKYFEDDEELPRMSQSPQLGGDNLLTGAYQCGRDGSNTRRRMLTRTSEDIQAISLEGPVKASGGDLSADSTTQVAN